MPRKKTTEADDKVALQAWMGKQQKPKRNEVQPAERTQALRAAIADEFMRLHHALRSRGAIVVIPNDDEPDHPGWRVVSLTDTDEGAIILNITRADHRWSDRPYPDKPWLTRGGAAGWGWFAGQISIAPSSRMWRSILEQANVSRHPLLKDA